jgi:hypothetical protein
MSWGSFAAILKSNPTVAIFAGIALIAGVVKLHEKLRVVAWYLIVCLVAAGVAFATHNSIYFFVFMLGMLTAAAEIIGKFRDEPIKALSTTQGFFYHIFNGLVAVFALYVVLLYNVSSSTPLDRLKIVVTAGLGSMLVMRSKLFNIKVGNEDVSFGPDQIVKVYFRFMEEAIDRVRASARIEFVKKIMDNLNFGNVCIYTQTMLDSAQTLSKDDAQKLKDSIKAIKDQSADLQLQSYSLGFLILNEMGEDFLTRLFAQRPTDWLIRAEIPQGKQEGILEKIPFLVTKDDSVRFFAYGSSMSTRKFREQMGWEESDAAKFIELTSPKKACLKGYRLVFNKPAIGSLDQEGSANLVPDPNGKVEGVLYRVSKTAFEFLDKRQMGYRRETVKVAEDGHEVEAQAYIAEQIRDGLNPSGAYLKDLLASAQQWQLSQEYLDTLKNTQPIPAAAAQTAASGAS